VENVMGRILQAPEAVPEKKSFIYYLRSSWIYVLLGLVFIVFLMTSDIPFTDSFPGKEYFTKHLFPYLSSLFSGLKPLLQNTKITSIVVMAVIAGGLLLGLDFFLSRKPLIRHQISQ
jgi:ABC-type phosphate transport system permease subunit